MITVFDTETTGLLEAEGNELHAQPHIIEICAIQIDDEGKIVHELDTLIKPPIPIPEHLTKHVHHISDYDVRNAPTFLDIWVKVADAFFGSHTSIGHNLSFDENIIINELKRIGKEYHFPYCPIKFCTVEQSMHIKGYRLKNGELYKIATGKELVGAHKARNDVMATYESYKFLKGIQ